MATASKPQVRWKVRIGNLQQKANLTQKATSVVDLENNTSALLRVTAQGNIILPLVCSV